MTHIPHLIKDLALILAAAGIVTLIFKRLKQPVVLGYVIAGFLIGPNFKLFPTITEIEGIRTWADIGVIFLLFALGLEFSFKKLVKVGGSAAVTGLTEISCMFALGFFAGRLMGWPMLDCIFLGGIISISSTTIIFRAFDELGLKTRKFANLVLGVLVIEDLVAILLMVLLSTVAVSKQFEGKEMIFSIFKLVFFLSLWFLSGIFLLPTFLKRTSKLLTSETLLIVSLALCLGMVLLAGSVGFSSALGAFIMGSILAETPQAEKIEHQLASVKDLFGAVFFISVGMLIKPDLLLEHAIPVLILTLAVVFGKTIFVSLGALLSGQPLKQSVQAGTSMSQIGEFSFIIANLGLSLKVTSNYLYPIAVGVSVITTFTTPYMMRLAEPLHQFLEKTLPAKWVYGLNRYSSNMQTLQSESDWRIVVRSYLQLILLNSVIIIACILLVSQYAAPFIEAKLQNPLTAKVATAIVALAFMMPFLWALTAKKIHSSAYTQLWLDSKYNHGPLVLLEVSRNIIAVLLLGFLLRRLFSVQVAFVGALIVMPIILYIFRQKLEKFYNRIQTRFLHNLNQKEIEENAKSLNFWDAHIVDFTVGAHADFTGKTLEELAWREQYGINVAFIDRAGKILHAPSRFEKLFPYDRIGVLATDQQLQQFKPVIEGINVSWMNMPEEDTENIGLMSIVIDEHTRLKGQSIRRSGIREKTDGLVVGIERNNERILNPASDTVFEWDDVVWLVGNRRKIKEIYTLDS
ncbi:cation:proton antiporter domain-containing protein [Foetidibacter luteolus]|uniref:cation:proton antiporter domain-containing protein n=1 Tax=Foetidibacter luteolus TaxID=2608880 RepID=UPI00129A7E64|nr:cation:proton antiporter [Foetidibacter luteolus]